MQRINMSIVSEMNAIAHYYDKNTKEIKMKHQIEVENMKCSGCMSSIRAVVLKIEGVDTISIDKDNDTITIEGNVEKIILVNALSKLGYPQKGDNALFKKAKSLLSCALGKMKEQ